jgi:hypothetical protein
MDDQPKEDDKKPVSVTLASDDFKLLVITFAGTVAANLVTVLFVGGAIVLVHSTKFPSKTKYFNLNIFLMLTTIVLISMATYLFRLYSQIRKSKYGKAFLASEGRNPLVLAAAFAVFLAILLLLFWVGIAAGIK